MEDQRSDEDDDDSMAATTENNSLLPEGAELSSVDSEHLRLGLEDAATDEDWLTSLLRYDEEADDPILDCGAEDT